MLLIFYLDIEMYPQDIFPPPVNYIQDIYPTEIVIDGPHCSIMCIFFKSSDQTPRIGLWDWYSKNNSNGAKSTFWNGANRGSVQVCLYGCTTLYWNCSKNGGSKSGTYFFFSGILKPNFPRKSNFIQLCLDAFLMAGLYKIELKLSGSIGLGE